MVKRYRVTLRKKQKKSKKHSYKKHSYKKRKKLSFKKHTTRKHHKRASQKVNKKYNLVGGVGETPQQIKEQIEEDKRHRAYNRDQQMIREEDQIEEIYRKNKEGNKELIKIPQDVTQRVMKKRKKNIVKPNIHMSEFDKKLSKICNKQTDIAPDFSSLEDKDEGENKCYNYYYEDSNGNKWPWRHNSLGTKKCDKRPNSFIKVNCDELKAKKRLKGISAL